MDMKRQKQSGKWSEKMPERFRSLQVSANAFLDDIAASKKSGMNEHLSKPIDFDEMMKRIGEYRKKVERNRS